VRSVVGLRIDGRIRNPGDRPEQSSVYNLWIAPKSSRNRPTQRMRRQASEFTTPSDPPPTGSQPHQEAVFDKEMKRLIDEVWREHCEVVMYQGR